MAQNASTPSKQGSSTLEREADHVDTPMNRDRSGEAQQVTETGANGLNNATQVAQDNRVDKAKADAKAGGGGPDQPEDGLNQDG